LDRRGSKHILAWRTLGLEETRAQNLVTLYDNCQCPRQSWLFQPPAQAHCSGNVVYCGPGIKLFEKPESLL
jgi:hypothetical protein